MKYGRIHVEGKNIPEDEPLFLLRGQDELSYAAVMSYAGLMRLHGYPDESIDTVIEHANLMKKWVPKKMPD